MSQSKLTFPQSDAATIGICVVSIPDGKVVVQNDMNKAMIPASTLKAVTSASVLLELGPDHTIDTPVYYTGKILGTELVGDIVVTPSLDPTIGCDNFEVSTNLAEEIAQKLNQLGVKKIKGIIKVEDNNFADSGLNPQWTVGDAAEDYGAGLFGFNFSENVFTYRPLTGETIPEQPPLLILEASSPQQEGVEHGINSDTYLITPKMLSRTSIMLPMSDPAGSFEINAVKIISNHGIKIIGEDVAETNKTLLLTHKSPKVLDILRHLMFRSHNMMAEAMLRSLTPESTRSDALNKELEILNSIGVKTHVTRIVDGSGLARMDRLTPGFLADVLVAMANSELGEKYVSLFPKVGTEGTVKSFLKNTKLKGKLALKSGSINGVHCYAGYKLNSVGKPTHAVVILVNNFFCTRDILRNAISKWLVDQFK